jgi:hypothetical protein
MATADRYVVSGRQHRQLADAAGPVACCAYMAGITNDTHCPSLGTAETGRLRGVAAY